MTKTKGKGEILNEIQWYTSELANLNSKILKWLQETNNNVKVKESQILLIEELPGEYEATRYSYFVDDKEILSLNPYGIWIVGARARVELEGPVGKEPLVYLFPYKTETHSIKARSSVRPDDISFEFGQKREGWHWFDDPVRGDLLYFDKKTFFKILESVS